MSCHRAHRPTVASERLGCAKRLTSHTRQPSIACLFADEATLTGEPFPAEKAVAVLPVATPLGDVKSIFESFKSS